MAPDPHVDTTRRRVLGALAGLAATAPFFAGDRTGREDAITLRYTAHVPRSHGLYTEGFVPFSRMVEEETGGRLRLEPFMDKLLHGALDGFKATISGVTDYTHAYATYQPGSFRLLHALQLPFLFENPPVANLIAEELYPRHFKAEYERMGVYLAHCDTTSPYNIISRDPVRRLDDLSGVKIRVTGGLTADIFQTLGAVPVVMAAAEVYTAFQRGVLDAVALGAPDMAAYRLQEIGRYFTRVDVNVTVLQYCLNRRSFDALPSDLKENFYRLLRLRGQMTSQNYYAGPHAERALSTIEEAGVTMIELTATERARFRRAVAPLKERFIAETGAEDVVRDLERLAAEYATMSFAEIRERVERNPIQGIIDL